MTSGAALVALTVFHDAIWHHTKVEWDLEITRRGQRERLGAWNQRIDKLCDRKEESPVPQSVFKRIGSLDHGSHWPNYFLNLFRNFRAVRASGSPPSGADLSTARKAFMTSPVIHLGVNRRVRVVRFVRILRRSICSCAVAIVLNRTKMVVIRGTWVSQLLRTKIILYENLYYLSRYQLVD